MRSKVAEICNSALQVRGWLGLGPFNFAGVLGAGGLQAAGVRFICTSQNIDTDESNPASRFLLHILMAAAEFERELIRERSLAGLKRYHREHQAGKVGKETRSRSGKNLPIGRPRRVFNRQQVAELRREGLPS